MASGKTFCKCLESHGWELKRIAGNHHVYMKAGSSSRISVPVHGNRPLMVGLLRHLMRVAEMTDTDLE